MNNSTFHSGVVNSGLKYGRLHYIFNNHRNNAKELHSHRMLDIKKLMDMFSLTEFFNKYEEVLEVL